MISGIGTTLAVVFIVFVVLSPFLIGMFLRSIDPRHRPEKFVSFFSRLLIFFAWWFFPLMRWIAGAVEGVDINLDAAYFATSFIGAVFVALTLWAGFMFRPVEWWRGRKGSF